MLYDLSTPTFEDLGDFLHEVEAVRLPPSCSSLNFYHQGQTIMGFSSLDSLPSAFEPTPIDPKSTLVVEDHPLAVGTWKGDDNLDRFMSSLLTLFEEASNDPTNCHSGPVTSTARKAPKRDLDDRSLVQTLPRKRARPMSPDTDGNSKCSSDADLRSSHVEQWKKRFDELVDYQKQHGHCLVPLNWEPNPSLAHWVKRQRYQYRIKNEGNHSTMTPERQEALEKLGFVWDSHSAAWLERWQELADFKTLHGHSNVPKMYSENRQLAIWVKCQRRQFKLFTEGQSSNMTLDRIECLDALGFVFNPRKVKATLDFP
jgi:Helicase associated domain